ncbi:hypothetical protein VitviT2T_020377 [Vitis vinifera]|uniref:Uncharacterized protein n=1 Tax=Vitis vinifera TaxID=29760 RepID=A0ABY9D645_VITVI|nr:hypothetical protein VitviT2T_020377 [Vitis vinifera]
MATGNYRNISIPRRVFPCKTYILPTSASMPLPLRKQNCFLASARGVGILDLRDLDGSNSQKICQMHPRPSLIQSADSSDPSLFSSLQSTSADSRGPNILLSVAYLSIPCMYAFLACQVNA